MSGGGRRKRGRGEPSVFWYTRRMRGSYAVPPNGSQPVSVRVGLSLVRYEIMYADISLSGSHSVRTGDRGIGKGFFPAVSLLAA
jgi:hypothetical protein